MAPGEGCWRLSSARLVAPDLARPIAPDDALAIAPDDPFAVAPDDALAVAPDDPLAVAPDDALAVAPDDALAVAPDDALVVGADEVTQPAGSRRRSFERQQLARRAISRIEEGNAAVANWFGSEHRVRKRVESCVAVETG